MTDKQKTTIRDQIKKIRLTLASEKRKFGGFDDSKGLRYLPTKLYVKLKDFDGGLKYLKWFNKNFPDDIGFPEFLFESTVIYFMKGMVPESENYALKAHFSNKFLIDKYFNRSDYLQNFGYRHDEEGYLVFSDWLDAFIKSEKFLKTNAEYNEIEKLLETEAVGRKRDMLIKKLHRLI